MKIKKLLGVASAFSLTLAVSAADVFAGGSARREQIIAQYSQCEWTNEMGRKVHECIVENNGFSTLWCFNTTVENSCQKDVDRNSANQDRAVIVAQNEAETKTDVTPEQEEWNRASRMGEENVVGTFERERTMHKYRNCHFTKEMSKYVYDCVVRNNGFNTHWCFDETLQTFCKPEPN
jgi:hypothetical protein